MQQNWTIVKGLVLVGFIFLAITIPAYCVSAEPSTKWIDTYGGAGDDEGYSVINSDQGYVFIGITNSSGLGQYDVLLIKTDSVGSMEWNRTYGGSFNDMAYSVVTTIDGGYALAGSTNSFGSGDVDYWLLKVDSQGNLEWNQTYDGQGYDSCRSLVASSDGGYALLGYTIASRSESTSSGLYNSDVWLVKVDSFGNMEWTQTYGGPIADYCDSMVTSGNGDYTLACISQPPVRTLTPPFGDGVFWLLTVDSLGGLELNQTYGVSAHHSPTSVLIAEDGSSIFGGSTRDNSGFRDFWLAKIGETEMESEFLIIGLSLTLVVLLFVGLLFYKRTKNSNKRV